MKFLLDTCVWGGASNELRSAGHDVIWAGEWPDDPGDDEILDRAHREGRMLVTLDKDFGELAVFYGMPHSGIIRLVNIGARQQAPACLRVVDLHEEDLKSRAIITVEPNRLRIRLATTQEK
jgi:predicted nuclease of predicted toxin-antitoxin system